MGGFVGCDEVDWIIMEMAAAACDDPACRMTEV